MLTPIVSRVYRSYLETVAGLIEWARSHGRFEVAGYVKGVEEDDCVIITEMAAPLREAVFFTRPELFQTHTRDQIESIYGKDYELITSRDGCFLTRRFYQRVKDKYAGGVHSHATDDSSPRPSLTDLIHNYAFFQKGSLESKNIIQIIHTDKRFAVYVFPKKQMLTFVRNNKVNVGRFADWFKSNYLSLQVNDIEIVPNA